VGTIVHGDLKPANVLVTLPGLRAKLCDFGLSAVKKTVSTVSSMGGFGGGGGTLNWSSPEMFGPNPKKRSPGDIWSVGLVMWELLLDEEDMLPFQEMPYEAIKGELRSLNFSPADHFPLDQDDMAAKDGNEIDAFGRVHAFLVNRCWKVDPLARATAAEVTAALLAEWELLQQHQPAEEEEELEELALGPDHHPAAGVPQQQRSLRGRHRPRRCTGPSHLH
jgi:serine/threonine protein kinase